MRYCQRVFAERGVGFYSFSRARFISTN